LWVAGERRVGGERWIRVAVGQVVHRTSLLREADDVGDRPRRRSIYAPRFGLANADAHLDCRSARAKLLREAPDLDLAARGGAVRGRNERESPENEQREETDAL
jgi:hypothetical protein